MSVLRPWGPVGSGGVSVLPCWAEKGSPPVGKILVSGIVRTTTDVFRFRGYLRPISGFHVWMSILNYRNANDEAFLVVRVCGLLSIMY